ncbi:hypothetical protein SODALDRAFT_95282 [Sodiomyces alkalinus F11]|uniref:Uncharacterized protein n=1 Tax=Sodiomyces alkalinus (strain CBS 110278 / VKM F-3762 / F11) TaxID=1314773 RepID=A0A3N2Q0W4_SODAK|nr:hypothetical protein SODALDRAFT_95282 [Sodiomyces alkalinus F11]ROT40382.1 hypothetical protein SODALDRAFT_95282 [Sodiomyces alkalinus F11]
MLCHHSLQSEVTQPLPLHPSTANNPFLLQLARSKTPTVLYEAPPHFWLKFTAWSSAIACYAGAGLNCLYSVSGDFPGAPWWVSSVYTAVCIAMAGVGSFFVFGSANIIKSIRAVPTASLGSKALASAAGTVAHNPRLTPIHLEVAVKPILPFFRKPSIVTVPPADVVLSGRLFKPHLTEAQARAARAREKAEAKARWEQEKQRLLTLPFRDAGRGAKAVWRGIRRGIVGGGFLKVMVGSRKCKLDVEGGWALNDGAALESLVRVNGAGTGPKNQRRS